MIARKSRISLDIEDLNNIINLLDLIDIYKILYSSTADTHYFQLHTE